MDAVVPRVSVVMDPGMFNQDIGRQLVGGVVLRVAEETVAAAVQFASADNQMLGVFDVNRARECIVVGEDAVRARQAMCRIRVLQVKVLEGYPGGDVTVRGVERSADHDDSF